MSSATAVHIHLPEDPNFAISTEGCNLLAAPVTRTGQSALEATFRAFCEQAGALAVMSDHLQVAATATEAKQMTTQRVALQNRLDPMLTHVSEYRQSGRGPLPIDRGNGTDFLRSRQ
jgi:hypothetical protein